MTPERMREKIALACGWTNLSVKMDHDTCTKELFYLAGCPPGLSDFGYTQEVPRYMESLDAMASAVTTLTGKQKSTYGDRLCDVMGYDDDDYVAREDIGDRVYHLNSYSIQHIARATAPQRAEAFLRTLGLYEETSST